MSTSAQRFDPLKSELLSGPDHRPQSLAEIDVPQAVLESLALKWLYLSGPLSVLDLSEKLCVSFEVTTALYYRLRAEQLCQAAGMDGNIPLISITAQGRARALEALSHCQYAGAAPVSLASYVEQTRSQSVIGAYTSPAAVDRAFAHLVLEQETIRQLGTALNSGSSVFLYGPPGTGKTSMAEAMSRALAGDRIWIPYAVEVDGQIITIYDPAVHVRVPGDEPANCDKRWMLCGRPAVLVGGELTVEMLDLQFNPNTKYYVGPAQMKANNGVLIIDDFGRQRIRPDELLNRWVVPLDRRIDFLTLSGGKKIEIPFEMLVIFASNMNPFDLVDASFLRRIHTKIKVGAVSREQFREIFHRVAADRKVPFDPNVLEVLMDVIERSLNQELRSCYPRDIVDQACWAARYENRKPYLDLASLKRAVDAYFLVPE